MSPTANTPETNPVDPGVTTTGDTATPVAADVAISMAASATKESHAHDTRELIELPGQHNQRGGHITCWEERGTREEEFLLSVIGGTEGSINWNVAAYFFGNTKGATQKRFERFLQARGLLVSDFWVMRDKAYRAVDLLKNVYDVAEPGSIATRNLLDDLCRTPPPRSAPRDVGEIVVASDLKHAHHRSLSHHPVVLPTQPGSLPPSMPRDSAIDMKIYQQQQQQQHQRRQHQRQQQIQQQHIQIQRLQQQQQQQQQDQRQHQPQQQMQLFPDMMQFPAQWPLEIKLSPREELAMKLEDAAPTHTAAVVDAMPSSSLYNGVYLSQFGPHGLRIGNSSVFPYRPQMCAPNGLTRTTQMSAPTTRSVKRPHDSLSSGEVVDLTGSNLSKRQRTAAPQKLDMHNAFDISMVDPTLAMPAMTPFPTCIKAMPRMATASPAVSLSLPLGSLTLPVPSIPPVSMPEQPKTQDNTAAPAVTQDFSATVLTTCPPAALETDTQADVPGLDEVPPLTPGNESLPELLPVLDDAAAELDDDLGLFGDLPTMDGDDKSDDVWLKFFSDTGQPGKV